MLIHHLDHLVLTVTDIRRSCAFYEQLGMTITRFGNDRTALNFGEQKINLHQAGEEVEPKATFPTPGSADLCFITKLNIPELIAHLRRQEIDIIEGPVERTGARGPLLSIYIRDPDLNLIEIANER